MSENAPPPPPTPTPPPTSKASKTEWPKSKLALNEKRFMSVSCGNTSLQWALHGCKNGSLHPVYFWRTPHLTEEDVEVDSREDLVQALSRHLAEDGNGFLFGSEEASLGAAQTKTEERGHPATFYIVSTSPTQLDLLSKLLGAIPCRIFEMQASDFYTEEEGAYKGMGIDRLANALGAANVDGLPALIIDGGSALTYTAIGSDGSVMGGGISPGIAMRLKAMNEFTGALPAIDLDEAMEKLMEQTIPSSIFAENTNDAMVLSTLHEVSCHLRGVVQSWKELVKDQKKRGRPPKTDAGTKEMKVNSDRIVSITGGSGRLIAKLLSKDNGGVLSATMKDIVESKFITGLIHFGITHAVCNRSGKPHDAANISEKRLKKAKSNKSSKEYDEYIGVKVAKNFADPDADGEYTYRGEVTEHQDWNGSRIFRVLYSDGDSEDVSESELEQMIAHYQQVGEKLPDPNKESMRYIHARVAKIFFGDQTFFGTVKNYTNGFWHIDYDDGDNEDMDADELLSAIKLHREHKKEDPENN